MKAKYVRVELRKIETTNRGEELMDLVGQNPISLWEAQDDHDHDTLSNVCMLWLRCFSYADVLEY